MRILLPLAGFVLFAVGCGAGTEVPSTGEGGGELADGADTYGMPVDDPGASEGDVGDPGDAPLAAVDDADAESFVVTEPAVLAGATMRTTANLNLRKGAGTSYAVLAVIPSGTTVTLLDATAKSGFYNIKHNGTAGWSSAKYLVATTGGGGGGTTVVDVNGAPSPDNAVARAAASVGFSYWWGGGAWLAAGASSSNAGSCSGSCPSCSHSGKYGADCSGMVAKAWQFGTKALDVSSHPYSTASFVSDAPGKWSTVSRGALRKGDALVYNSGGAGHIVLWEKGDGWGSSTVYECRGCSYGCVHNTRTFTSSYHGIRRAGF